MESIIYRVEHQSHICTSTMILNLSHEFPDGIKESCEEKPEVGIRTAIQELISRGRVRPVKTNAPA